MNLKNRIYNNKISISDNWIAIDEQEIIGSRCVPVQDRKHMATLNF